MKQFKWFFIACSISLFSLGSCKNKDPEVNDLDLPRCTDLGDYLMEYKKIKNEVASMEIRISKHNGVNDTIYLINYPKNDYRYLYGCNLPSEFMKDSLQIKFSGTVYIPKEHEKINLGWLSIELTNVQINPSL